jgi:hypothetical protein
MAARLKEFTSPAKFTHSSLPEWGNATNNSACYISQLYAMDYCALLSVLFPRT